jgi:magnesium transporter
VDKRDELPQIFPKFIPLRPRGCTWRLARHDGFEVGVSGWLVSRRHDGSRCSSKLCWSSISCRCSLSHLPIALLKRLNLRLSLNRGYTDETIALLGRYPSRFKRISAPARRISLDTLFSKSFVSALCRDRAVDIFEAAPLLKLYRVDGDASDLGSALAPMIIWIDLLNATDEEKSSVQRVLDVELPTERSLNEIEASSRLISRHGLLYLSSPAVRVDDEGEAHLTPVGFVIGPRVLVTIRFAASPVFDSVRDRVQASDDLENGMCVFIALLEAIVDRGADVLENLGAKLDKLSRRIFRGGLVRSKRPVRSSRRMREALESVGTMADTLSRARDVLLGVQRVAAFAGDARSEWITEPSKKRLDSVYKDVASLSDYETRLSDKIQLVLDATLGFINIQQNDLFKILTIVSVVGVPPTILVGIWGMNFKNMPELNWQFGYLLAWLAVIASGLIPLLWFRARGWFD